MNQDSLPGQASTTNDIMRLPLHRIISNPNFQQPSADSGPGQEVIGCTEGEQHQQQEQNHPVVDVSLKQSDDSYLTTTENIHSVLPTTQPLTTENIREKSTVLPSTSAPPVIHRVDPALSDEQACGTTTANQKVPKRLYSKPRDVLTDSKMEVETPHESPISKLQNTVSGHAEKFLSITLQYLPEADIATDPGSTGLLSVDLKSTMFAERMRVNLKSYNVTATQTPSQCDKISQETKTTEMPSTPSDTTPKHRDTLFMPEDDEDTLTELPVSSRDPSQYDPLNVEEMAQTTLGTTQYEGKQQHRYNESLSTVQQQHPSCRVTKYLKSLLFYYPKRFSSPQGITEKNTVEDFSECATPESPDSTDAMQDNTFHSQGERKTVNMSSNDLADLNQQKTSLEKPKPTTNVVIQNNEELSRSEHLDRSVHSPDVQETEHVSHESQLYPYMEQPPPSCVQPTAAISPAYMAVDEAKEVVTTSQIQVVDNVEEVHDWNTLPGPAVSSRDSQFIPQTPVSLPVTTDRDSHAPIKQKLDVGTHKAPVYVPVMIRAEDLQRFFGTHFISLSAGARSDPYIVDADSVTNAAENFMAAQ